MQQDKGRKAGWIVQDLDKQHLNGQMNGAEQTLEALVHVAGLYT